MARTGRNENNEAVGFLLEPTLGAGRPREHWHPRSDRLRPAFGGSCFQGHAGEQRAAYDARAEAVPHTRGPRARISRGPDLQGLPCQWVERSVEPPARLYRSPRDGVCTVAARGRRARAPSTAAVACPASRVAGALADNQARLRRRLELHRRMAGADARRSAEP